VEYRRSGQAIFDIKYHFVWVTKYRYKVLRGRVAERAGEADLSSQGDRDHLRSGVAGSYSRSGIGAAFCMFRRECRTTLLI
jgi:hypothetical protein